MERVVAGEQSLRKVLLPSLIVFGVAFALVVIVYGLDSIAPGVHDVFHDFRHVIGIPCH